MTVESLTDLQKKAEMLELEQYNTLTISKERMLDFLPSDFKEYLNVEREEEILVIDLTKTIQCNYLNSESLDDYLVQGVGHIQIKKNNGMCSIYAERLGFKKLNDLTIDNLGVFEFDDSDDDGAIASLLLVNSKDVLLPTRNKDVEDRQYFADRLPNFVKVSLTDMV